VLEGGALAAHHLLLLMLLWWGTMALMLQPLLLLLLVVMVGWHLAGICHSSLQQMSWLHGKSDDGRHRCDLMSRVTSQWDQ
jgi:hypothetical protein